MTVLAAARRSAVPAKRLGRWRLTRVAVCTAMVALPLLRPTGPLNTGLVDLALLGAMCVAGLWASIRAHRIQLPYAVPVALMILGGALAATHAGLVGDATLGLAGQSVVAIFQDVFVFAWAAAIATLGQDEQLLDLFCRAWAYSATAWAALLIVGELLGISAITGITAREGIRASLTLGDPNLAADYFLVALFVMRAAQRPRRARWRWLACALVITGIVLTLSNGGVLALLVATAVGALFRVARRHGLGLALVLGASLALVGAVVYRTVDLNALVTSAAQSSPFLRDSVGRSAESGGSRTTLIKESVVLYLNMDNVLGLGPANTETTLSARQAAYVKEAHDDYVATLLERGLIGSVGLILLVASVGVRSRRIARSGWLPPDYRDAVPRPDLLGAGLVAVGMSAAFYETLHFRHVWALFGLIAALELAGRPPVHRSAS